ncbi:uncharacterized protein LOC131243458 [Magnolia sinica]|uniref:uncharacterized protein LOC131243458 n=1 Tax=Magnolia sinica TaxID=86752 RepID=UPI00265A1194|nr:uncharacterized protein LOC131243458 [Magnolia sinica]
MEAHILPFISPNSAFFLRHKPPFPTQTSLPPTLTKRCRVRAVNTNAGNEGNQTPSPSPSPSPLPPPASAAETVEIRFRRGLRKRAKQQQDGIDGTSLSSKPPSPPKDWDSMTISEKAVELYMGEKGLLFWLNKFAYASIFIIIGAWILFRFVGPTIGLYQLDAPPLPPTSMLKGP